MVLETTGDWSGSGGGGGDERPPNRWHPDDKVGKLFYLPRSKGAGGKHFVPANWIDRMLALAIGLAGDVGTVTRIMGDLQTLVGDDAPLELSTKYMTEKSSSSPYASLTDSSELGLLQVLTTLREQLREWGENIFPHDQESTGDDGGRIMDIPRGAGVDLVRRLAAAAASIIQFFDRWIGGSDRAVDVVIEGRNAPLTWRQVRELIQAGVTTMVLRANLGGNKLSPNWKML